jgi:hypothetical protein
MSTVSYEYKGFKLGEKKAIREHEATATKFVNDVVSKLGAGWSVVFDWDSFAAKAPEGERMNLGKILYAQQMKGLAAEMASLDDEIIEALNDAVGADKTITWVMGGEGEDYKNAGDTFRIEGFGGGVKIFVNPRYGLGTSYPYPQGDSLKGFILKNC